MRIYLDNCVLNRPFDDQTQTRIKTETTAILKIRKKIEEGHLELAWSYLNDFEMSRNPFADIRESAREWKQFATTYIDPSLEILRTAFELRDLGLKSVDSLHIASAFESKIDYFISTDDGILSKLGVYRKLRIAEPVTFLSNLEAV